MTTRRLTDLVVRSLDTDRPQETVWSDRLTGFGVRVSGSTGRKVFVVRYRADGRRRRVTLGPYPRLSLADARAQARFILRQAAAGRDPAGPSRETDLTFEELTGRYLEAEARPTLSAKRAREIERALAKDVLPRIGSLPARAVDRRHVAGVLDAVAARGAPVQANRLRSMISNVFRYGEARNVVDGNPALEASRPAREAPRRRTLSDAEIRELWRALEGAPAVSGSVLRFRLLTGQRGKAIRHMRKDRIRDGWWTVPDGIRGRGPLHRVWLAPQARALVRALEPHHADGPYVLPSPRTGGPLSDVGYALERVRERLDFAFEPRDLRRTVSGRMTDELGIAPHVVDRVLGRGSAPTAAGGSGYSYADGKRAALEAWGDRLEELVHRIVPEL